MVMAISWFFVLSLLALWSMAAWLLHAVATWAVTGAGGWSGATTGLGEIALPGWLAAWVPPEVVQALGSLLSGLAPVIEGLLQAAPVLAGALTVAAWVIWALGAGLLLVLGAGLHLLLVMWRRHRGEGGPPVRLRSAA